jgi:hypothetical protein
VAISNVFYYTFFSDFNRSPDTVPLTDFFRSKRIVIPEVISTHIVLPISINQTMRFLLWYPPVPQSQLQHKNVLIDNEPLIFCFEALINAEIIPYEVHCLVRNSLFLAPTCCQSHLTVVSISKRFVRDVWAPLPITIDNPVIYHSNNLRRSYCKTFLIDLTPSQPE